MIGGRCGTPSYIAPEIFNQFEYNYKVDLFSLGVILYILVAGVVPFRGGDEKEKLRNNIHCIVMYPERYFGLCTSEYKSLLENLITPTAESRLDIDQVFQHPWLCKTKVRIIDSLTIQADTSDMTPMKESDLN